MNIFDVAERCWEDTKFDVGYVQMAVNGGYWEYLCDDLDEDDYPTDKGREAAQGFIARAANWTEFGWWLYSLYCFTRCFVQQATREAYCEVYDHNWHCEDWATPDTGGMGATCKRCGYGFSHTLY